MTAIYDNMDFCRVCESTGNLENIFDETNIEILRMLRSVAPSGVKLNDGLPKYICTECTHKLIDTFNFQSLYKYTYNKFKTNYEPYVGRPLEYQQEGVETFIIQEIDENLVESEITIKKEYVDHLPEGAQRNEEPKTIEPKKKRFSHQLCADLKPSLPVKFRSGMQNETQLLNSNPEMCKWNQCEKANFTEHHLKVEQSLHTEKSCEAVKQPESYASRQDFYLKPALYKCDNCGKGYKFLASLKEHKCEGYKCNICGKTYSVQLSLTMHESLHINPNLHKCNQCNKSFISLRSLKLHRVKHLSLNSVTCKVCGKQCKNSRSLAVHVQSH